MPSRLGSPPEVPCVSCGERVAGLAWGERCPACRARIRRTATRLARRISLLAALITALILGSRIPPGDNTRLWIGAGTLAVFALVRVIAQRVLEEGLQWREGRRARGRGED